jgi:hypothetical protein
VKTHWLPVVALLLGARSLEAQRFGIGVDATHLTLKEIAASRQWSGLGFGVTAAAHVGPLAVELAAVRAGLEPARGDSSLSAFHYSSVDVRAAVPVYRSIAVEVGAGRHWPDPALAVQDVGYVRLGVRVAGSLDSRSQVWVRAAYLPIVRFSGGGRTGLSVETAFGLTLGLGRHIALRADYLFQRMDRESGGQAWPTQVWTARLGASVLAP